MHYSGAVLFGKQRAGLIGDSDSSARVLPPDHAPGSVAVILALNSGAVPDFGSYTYQSSPCHGPEAVAPAVLSAGAS